MIVYDSHCSHEGIQLWTHLQTILRFLSMDVYGYIYIYMAYFLICSADSLDLGVHCPEAPVVAGCGFAPRDDEATQRLGR